MKKHWKQFAAKLSKSLYYSYKKIKYVEILYLEVAIEQ